ncbi:MAG: hypothetical protein NVSMB43_02580 [Pseudarthrobacter sp.]
MAGRGAWLHPSETCLALAVKRRAFGRALNGATGVTAVERWILARQQAASPLQKSEPMPLAAAAKTVQPESGSEN